MKTFAALVLKDLRAVRGWIGVTWLFIAAFLLCPQRGAIGDDALGWPERSSWLVVGACFMIVFMQRSLLGIDPPLGDRRFMGTRPAWGGAVLGSKVLVILMAGVLPVALAAAARLWCAGLDVTAGEGFRVAFEDGVFLLCLLGFLTLRHVLPGYSLWAAGLGIFACFVTLMSIRTILVWVPIDESSDSCFSPVNLYNALGFALWAALAGRYAQWRWWMRLILFVLATAAMTSGIFAWQYAHRIGAPDAAAPPAGVHPVFESKNSSWSCTLIPTEVTRTGRDENGNDAMEVHFHVIGTSSARLEVRQGVRVKDLPSGVWVEQTLSEGTFHLDGEPGESSFRWDTRGMQSWNVPPQAAAGALPGTPSLTTFWGDQYLAVARVKVHGVKKSVPFKTTLRGRHHFDVYRAELVTLLPIKEGVVWSGDHVRLEFTEGLGVPRVEARVWVTGDVFSRHSSAVSHTLNSGVNELGFYGVNFPAQRLMLMGGNAMTYETFAWQRRAQVQESWGFGMGTYRWVLPGEAPPGDEQADEKEMLDHRQTQIGIFRRVKIGSVVIPFELVDQVLTPK